MTKEQAIYILSSYRQANRKSELMLEKIKTMENGIYNAQAGYVENEAGVHVSGGTHISRAEKIASLVDLKDKYAERYTASELLCSKIMEMIERIYTHKQRQPDDTGEKLLKLQKYEQVLIDYYIVGTDMAGIERKNGYSRRQASRIKGAAIDNFCSIYKDTPYEQVMEG